MFDQFDLWPEDALDSFSPLAGVTSMKQHDGGSVDLPTFGHVHPALMQIFSQTSSYPSSLTSPQLDTWVFAVCFPLLRHIQGRGIRLQISHVYGDTQEWMIYNGKAHLEMDDLGVPLFQETSISHILKITQRSFPWSNLPLRSLQPSSCEPWLYLETKYTTSSLFSWHM